MYRIILDAMGGDHAPDVVIEGAVLALKEFSDLEICLVGRKDVIEEKLQKYEFDQKRNLQSMPCAPRKIPLWWSG